MEKEMRFEVCTKCGRKLRSTDLSQGICLECKGIGTIQPLSPTEKLHAKLQRPPVDWATTRPLDIQIRNLKTDEYDKQNPAHIFCARSKGFDNPLANPFKGGTREEKITAHKAWFFHHWKHDEPNSPFKKRILDITCQTIRTGHVELFCWCHPAACHTENIRDFILWIYKTHQITADHSPLDARDFFKEVNKMDAIQDQPDKKRIFDHSEHGEAGLGMAEHAAAMRPLDRMEFELCHCGTEKVSWPSLIGTITDSSVPNYLRPEYIKIRFQVGPHLAYKYSEALRLLDASKAVVDYYAKQFKASPNDAHLALISLAAEIAIVDMSTAPSQEQEPYNETDTSEEVELENQILYAWEDANQEQAIGGSPFHWLPLGDDPPIDKANPPEISADFLRLSRQLTAATSWLACKELVKECFKTLPKKERSAFLKMYNAKRGEIIQNHASNQPAFMELYIHTTKIELDKLSDAQSWLIALAQGQKLFRDYKPIEETTQILKDIFYTRKEEVEKKVKKQYPVINPF